MHFYIIKHAVKHTHAPFTMYGLLSYGKCILNGVLSFCSLRFVTQCQSMHTQILLTPLFCLHCIYEHLYNYSVAWKGVERRVFK